MIVGNIKDAKRYYSVNENFKTAFEFLGTLDSGASGSFEFPGFRVNIVESEGNDFDSLGAPRVFEAHKDYLDIHFCILGAEGMGYSDINKLEVVKEYDKTGDYMLLRGGVNKLILGEGDFCIVFPEDAHIPAMTGGNGIFKKAVVKIKL